VPLTFRLAFYGGWLVVLGALLSPLDWLGEERLLTAHMAQHLLLGDIAPLLIVVGLTGPMLRPLLALPGAVALHRWLHPLVVLAFWAGDLYVWHLPALYGAALADERVHALQHACFLGFGVLAWWVVIEPIPGRRWFGTGSKILYVFAMRLVGLVLANIVLWTPTVLYGAYAAAPRVWGIGALEDQEYAGGLMMLECSLVTIGVLVWLLNAWADESEYRQQLADQGFDARGGRARRPLTPGPALNERAPRPR
jgi:cytochrome c oxidase assembly factor CtaG